MGEAVSIVDDLIASSQLAKSIKLEDNTNLLQGLYLPKPGPGKGRIGC